MVQSNQLFAWFERVLRRTLALGVILALVWPGSVLGAGPAVIDPEILAGDENEPVPFLIVLRSQPDPDRLPARPGGQSAAARVALGLRESARREQAPLLERLDQLGVTARPYWIVNLIAVKAPPRVAEELAARPEVAALVSNRPFRVDLPGQAAGEISGAAQAGIEWNLAEVGAPALWSAGYTGQGIIVANADTGVDWTHPALKPHYLGWDGAAADHDYAWWDAIHEDLNGTEFNPCGYNSPEPCDDNLHGTHTTGTMVGDDGAGNQIGMAPGAKWAACRNMDSNFGQLSTYLECLQFFMAPWPQGGTPDQGEPDRHVDVISNSYVCPLSEGCDPSTYPIWETALQNVRAAGIFMAVAAGNSGPSCGTVKDPPGISPSVFSVGAVGSDGQIASFSSRGPASTENGPLLKPDLVAPGMGIRSSVPPGLTGGSLYQGLQGTSMATPHVAGAVALLWSALPDLRGDVDATELLLQQSAVKPPAPLTQLCGGDTVASVPNHVYGWGILNAWEAYLQETLTIRFWLPLIWNQAGP